MKRVLAPVVLAVLLLGACGDDGDSGGNLNAEEQRLADEISTSLQQDQGDDIPISADEADCVGVGMVERLGADKLGQIDFMADDPDFALSAADADAAADVMVDCIDVQSAFATMFAEDGEISQESADCLAGQFDNDTVKPIFAAVFQGIDENEVMGGEFMRVVTQGMADCLTDEEFARMMG